MLIKERNQKFENCLLVVKNLLATAGFTKVSQYQKYQRTNIYKGKLK